MGLRSQIVRQRDFSGGELVPEAKRRDDLEQVRAGARQMLNLRMEAPGTACERPGRRALFQQNGRTETILMTGSLRFRVSFGDNGGGSGTVVVRDSTGATLYSASGFPWTAATAYQITYAVINLDIVVTFPGAKPRVVRRNTDGSWTSFAFAFRTGYQGQSLAPFYRFRETLGITLTPGGTTGSISLTFSAAFLTPGHVNTIIRYKKRQILITAYASPTSGTGTVIEELPSSQQIGMASSVGFYVGQVVQGAGTGATGEIISTTPTSILVVLNTLFSGFTNGETVVSPTGRQAITSLSTSATPYPSLEWDELACSDNRGWPRACLNDRNRLAFCDLPQLPEGIIWSATAAYDDFYVGTDATAAIFETCPGRARALYMTGGPDQFVFTDRGVFYIPISETNPLKPGSVTFRQITADAVGAVRPVSTSDGIVYVNAGLSRVQGIIQTGAQSKPYQAMDATEFSKHLIKTPVCLAASSGDSQFPEKYVYLVNTDGTMAVGRLSTDRKWIGWTPWSGTGLVRWASSLTSETLFSTDYVGNATQPIVEVQDSSAYVDGKVTYNSVVTPLAPPGGGLTGKLWMYAGMTVDVMDGLRDLGQRSVDASGAIVILAGDDFSASTIVAGLSYQSTFEPFIPHAGEGPDFEQTMKLRRLRQMGVAVRRSLGFEVGNRTIPRYDWGEDADNQPVQREQTYRFRKIGRDVDPRTSITRTRPGTLTLVEVSLEVTV